MLCWVAGKGYALFHGASLGKMGVEPLLAYLEQLDQGGYPYDIVQVRYSVGGDNGPPDPAMCDYVREWNQAHVYPQLAIATTARCVRDFEQRYGDKLPQVRGDFTPYWEDGAASSARETAHQSRARPSGWCRPKRFSPCWGRTSIPADDFYTAWRNVLLYDEHTWGAHNSISEPDAQFVKDQWTIKQAFALDGQTQSSGLLNAALESRRRRLIPDVVDRCDQHDILVTDRSGACCRKGSSRTGAVVKEANGTIVPSQRLSDRRVGVPGQKMCRHSRRNGIPSTAGNSSDGGRAKADGTTLTNGQSDRSHRSEDRRHREPAVNRYRTGPGRCPSRSRR